MRKYLLAEHKDELQLTFIVQGHFYLDAADGHASNIDFKENPTWRILELDISKFNEDEERLPEGEYAIVVMLPKNEYLRRYVEVEGLRDAIVGFLSLGSFTPVRLKHAGSMCYLHAEPNRYACTSLGWGNLTGDERPLPDYSALLNGMLSMKPLQAVLLDFFRRAIGTYSTLERFFYLSSAISIIVDAESPVEGYVVPTCDRCNSQMPVCAECGLEKKIPTPYREQAVFLFEDRELLSAYIQARNSVAHASLNRISSELERQLSLLNPQLLRLLGNHLRSSFSLPLISAEQQSLAVDPPVVRATVYFTMPT